MEHLKQKIISKHSVKVESKHYNTEDNLNTFVEKEGRLKADEENAALLWAGQSGRIELFQNIELLLQEYKKSLLPVNLRKDHFRKFIFQKIYLSILCMTVFCILCVFNDTHEHFFFQTPKEKQYSLFFTKVEKNL
jgi:hypothetical protein